MNVSRPLHNQGCLFTGIYSVLFLSSVFPISASEIPCGTNPIEPQFWSFRPIDNPTPPDVKDLNWCQSPIDQFILAQLEQEGYPFPFILEEMKDYLEICDELSRA